MSLLLPGSESGATPSVSCSGDTGRPRSLDVARAPASPSVLVEQGEAFDDKRHLWPEFFRLIEARKPIVCFGEQVASIDGLAWLDLVQSGFDDAGYGLRGGRYLRCGLRSPSPKAASVLGGRHRKRTM